LTVLRLFIIEMTMTESKKLLIDYADAVRASVWEFFRRYVDLVISTAIRWLTG